MASWDLKSPVEAAKLLTSLDHCILSREEAREIVAAMGMDDKGVPVYETVHRPDLVKGARINGATHIGQKFLLIGADELATWLCRTLELEFRGCFGRGSQLREAGGALIKHFEGVAA